MPWYKSAPVQSQPNVPNYGASTSHSIDHNGSEVIAAGAKSRIMSISVSEDADDIYVEYAQAPSVATGGYKFKLFAGGQSNKIEIPPQAVHMATAEAGKTADIIIAVSQ